MNHKAMNLKAWDLDVDSVGQLTMGGIRLTDLAQDFGTPLHVMNEFRLAETASRFLTCAKEEYIGKVSVHYPFKCNSVPAVVQTIRRAGLRAEVMTEFELELALLLGFRGDEIIANGPCKTSDFLLKCLNAEVRFIIVDSLGELLTLRRLTESEGRKVNILLRVNPDYVPREMNQGSATGSRKRCAFGFDLKGGEVEGALLFLRKKPHISFQGFHFHIGTGIRHSRDYSNALRCLPILIREARSVGFRIQVFDVGGGFASMSTKEFTTSEMLLYQWLGKLPSRPVIDRAATFRDFTREISNTLMSYFSLDELPELIYEPGRCIASPNQLLLLTVHHIKERYGVGKWLITNGGLGTVTMPTYYEYHEVFLCNDVDRPRTEKVTIIGPACFAGDVVYRNKWMPEVRPGEVLAIMDTGAYFTALESSFGFPRPAIVFVHDGESRLVRKRETFEEMIQRDHWNKKKINEEELS